MKILCVCYGNTCRSPMLEGLLKEALKNNSNVQIESAGTLDDEGQPAHEYSIACMDKLGIDIRTHRSRYVAKLDLTQFDLIVCMEQVNANVVRQLPVGNAEVIVGNSPNGVDNPWEKGPQAYAVCIRTMEKVTADVVARYFP